jgi:hypothetical protein
LADELERGLEMRRGLRSALAFSFTALLVAVPGPGGVAAEEVPAEAEAALDRARELAHELTRTVQRLLATELKAGSFEGALRACAETAQEVTAEWQQRTGGEGRRVSLRYRNPADIPDAYEQAVLEKLDRLNAEGELPDEHFDVVAKGEARVLRYMRPLVANQLCLKCHGPDEGLAPEIRTLLHELYPEDRATGYAVGDVRGAVTVIVPLPASDSTPEHTH